MMSSMRVGTWELARSKMSETPAVPAGTVTEVRNG
jgi:hypothetical protein